MWTDTRRYEVLMKYGTLADLLGMAPIVFCDNILTKFGGN